MTTKTEAAAVEKKLPVLKEATVTANAVMAENFSMAKDGTSTISADAYAKLLPEGTTVEHVIAVRKTDALAAGALAHTVGIEGTNVMAKNKDLKEVTATLDMLGGKEVTVHLQDQQTYPGIKGADGVAGPSTTKYGVITAKITETASKSSTGEMGKIKAIIGAHAAERLSK